MPIDPGYGEITVIAPLPLPIFRHNAPNWPVTHPGALAPAIAAPLVSQLGGCPTRYLTVAAITVAGSAFVWKIRSVP